MKILITGGAGYIGSHTCLELLKLDYEIVVVDNFSNSKPEVIDKIKTISQKDFKFYQLDVTNKAELRRVFLENHIDLAIHFASFKAVSESVSKPLMYYHNNLLSTIILCELLEEFNCKKIIFSSSATVYGKPKKLPIKEDFLLNTTNPYGTTKLICENILRDLYSSDNGWGIVILRYFNPIGADSSGLIGEDVKGIPNNLMPYIVKVANKELECLSIFGDDYKTSDGTGVRDYIHVSDLARGHALATVKLLSSSGINTYNLGTGKGFSVLELVKTFEKVNKVKILYKIGNKRPGDIDACYADNKKASKELGFTTNKSIEDMCKDAWNFAKKNSTK